MSSTETPVTFDQRTVMLRRQMSDNLEEIQFIYNYGKTNVANVPTASAGCKAKLKGSYDALQFHYNKFNDLWAELGQLYDSNNKSLEFPTDEDNRYKKDIRNAYYSACGLIEGIKANGVANVTADQSTLNQSLSESRPTKNLPKLELPIFKGQLLEWPRFRDTYVSIVHEDKNLTPIERFHYLRCYLKGPAFNVISNLKVEEANYAVAWKALTDAYDNKRMLAAAYLDQILNCKPMQGQTSPDSLNNFLSTISETVSAFKLLEVPDESGFMLFHLSIRLLDPNTREQFELKYSNKPQTFPNFNELSQFVRERSLALQLSNPLRYLSDSSQPSNNQQSTSKDKHKPPKPRNVPKTSLIANKGAGNQKTPASEKTQKLEGSASCFICNKGAHNPLNCQTFNETSIPERIKLLSSWKGCVNCLSSAHKVSDCSSKWHCRYCPERHHSLLHPPSQSTSLTSSSFKEDHVILGTAVARIQDSRGHFQDVRLVIDSASQNSFITHRCLNRLGLKMTKTDRRISGIGQTLFDGAKGSATCVLKPRGKTIFRLTTEAIVVANITSYLPATPLPKWVISKFEDTELADPNFGKPGAIDFLLGADLFTEIWTGVVKESDEDGPKLLSSIFGFIVMGKIGASKPSTSTSLLVIDNSTDVNFQLERFWQMEEPVPTSNIVNPEDQRCEDHFLRTYYRLENGRYVVQLPFREDNPQVGDSSSVALRRFYNLERKLRKDGSTKEKYHEFLHEYEQLNHMSPATTSAKFMIPHHCISKDSPEGLKLKVVFDASVQVSGGSLNAHLLTGCKLQNDIRDIILRFRSHVIAFSTDLVKMFRMIEIHPPDRRYLQIYWRFDPNQQVQRYELNTVIYGLVCAPWIAQRVLKQLAADHGDQFPLAAEVLLRDSYVDDILTGAPSIEEATTLQVQLIHLLKCGGFDLSKWSSNSPKLLSNVQSAGQKELVDLSSPDEQWVKILGLQWDPQSDCFSFAIGDPSPHYTKRGILSTVARIYDPLGFLSPTILMMKGFIQDLWIKKLDWDDPLTDALAESWTRLTRELPQLSELRIPRFVGTSPDATSCQLVGFADASNRGYAAVLYLRVISPDGCRTSLLTSKSKLAPTKTQSIPRLELSGALLLAELYRAVLPQIRTFDLLLEPSVFFSDSQTVLAWLNTPPHKLKIFVSNRVARIQEITHPQQWRHVVSRENPSDAASRGIHPSLLLSHDLWWSGPPWLSKHPSEWPSSKIVPPEELDDLKPQETNTLVASNSSDRWIKWMARFSSYSTLVKSAGWLKRWMYNLRHMKCCCCPWRCGKLRRSEFEAGLTFCIKTTQAFYFKDHSYVLKKYANLRPYIDADGIWHVGGRLRHASVPESRKNPVLLPYEAHFSVLLVDYLHKIYLHPGPTTLQAVIQTQFWIPSLRRLIYLRGFRCKICYESRTNTVAPIMGDLPTYRVNGGRTFQHVGIDFAGPFPLKESSRRNAAVGKVYLCLYVCMATKALHLEAVTRLTTEAFLASFQRFTSRRGIPSDVYTDRGSNFLGAARYLKDLYRWFISEETKEALLEYAMQTKITWHFNPPHTPHMGGIWEAGVKSVKRYLRLIASDTALTYEEISTWFTKIEAILNSRPLCPLSTDPNENDYLSPGHFLVGGPLVVSPEPSLLDEKENLLSRWQLVTRLSEQFWQRWSSEYLSTLQKRPKWVKVRQNLEVGDLVLLKESSPPLHWKLARVTEVHAGEDGTVRVVTLRRGSSTFLRHVVNLVPLPHLSSNSYPETS